MSIPFDRPSAVRRDIDETGSDVRVSAGVAEPRPRGRAWGLGVTVGIHLALLAWMVVWPSSAPKVGASASALIVSVNVLPAAPPQPTPDQPKPAPPEKPVHKVAESSPVPVPKRVAPPPPVTDSETRLMPIPEISPPPVAPPPEVVASPPAPALPAGERAAAPVESDPNSLRRPAALVTWESRVLAHLERNKRYPATARLRRQEDVVYVRFVVDRSGRVSGARIVRSQGFELLDEEALALLKRATPLPPVPPEIADDSVELMVPIEFSMQSR